MHHHDSARLWLLILMLAVSGGLTACATAASSPAANSTTAGVQTSQIMVTSIEALSRQSEIVVLGIPITRLGMVNTSRNPNDPSKPDQSHFGIGQIYEVQVQQYIKGQGPQSFYLIQYQGSVATSSALTQTEIEQAWKTFKISPLILNQPLILFLKSVGEAYADFPNGALYFGVSNPWAFDIRATGCVQPTGEDTELLRYFPAQPLADFIKSIQQPDSSTQGAYPAPKNETTCAPKPTGPAYP